MDPWMVVQVFWAVGVVGLICCLWEKYYIPPGRPRPDERIDVVNADKSGCDMPFYVEVIVKKDKTLTSHDHEQIRQNYPMGPFPPGVRARLTGPIYEW